jgi:RNA polymerase sigma factor (sigma-70 family)
MAENQLGAILRHLYPRIGPPGVRLTDAQLLEQFLRHRDHAAFEMLVHRHGPMVLGVCKRVLRREHDAEDAFQATFLALVRKAGSIGNRASVASWLYKVGYRIALGASTRRATRAAREQSCPDLAAAEARPQARDPDLRRVLDEEVNRLPEKYRAVFVLCQVEGRTIAEAARALECPCGTVGTRLARARQRLRSRLSRRGFGPAAGVLAAVVPPALASGTVRAAGALTAAKTAGAIVPPAAILTERVLRAMLMSKLKMVALVMVTVGLAGTAAGVAAYRAWAGEPAAEPPAADRAATLEKEVRAAREELDRVQARLAKVQAELLPAGTEEPDRPFPHIEHDFGTVARGTQLHHRFPMKNTGKVPLTIIAVRTSCGCLTASASARALAPGQEGWLDVTLDASRFVGKKTVTIVVQVAGKGDVRLRVSADSRADLVVDPGRIDFGVVPHGRAVTRTIEVTYTRSLDWHLAEVIREGSPLDVKLEELSRRPGQVAYRIHATLRADAPVGTFSRELRLKTDDPATPLIAVPAEGTVGTVTGLVASPASLNLGSLRIGDTIDRRVVVRGTRPFRILGIEGLGAGLKTDWPETKAAVQVLQVRFRPAQLGEFKKTLRIRTDLEGEDPVAVTVEGTVVPRGE